jgi:hypothetical protein
MPPPVNPTEKASLARQNAQCLLVNNFGVVLQNSDVLLPTMGVRSGIKSARDVLAAQASSNPERIPLTTLETLITYHGHPDEVVNALTMDTPDLPPTAFINATPAQLSLLQPRLDFYIRTNVVDPNNPTHFLPKDRAILFSDHVSAEKQKGLAGFRAGENSDVILRGAEGYNVGIKEFTWNYDNKHEGDRIIKAQLTLYFGSMAELTNQYYLDFLFADGKRNVNQRTASEHSTTTEKIKELNSSLENRKRAVRQGSYNARSQSNILRDSQQLKVIVGWEMPSRVVPELFESAEDQKQFYQAVKNSQRTLLLNITQYDINFNQNGSCEVTIEYIASTDAYIGSPSADVFSHRHLPNTSGRDERDQAWVTADEGLLDWGGLGNEVWPEGYLKKEYEDHKGGVGGKEFDENDGVTKMIIYVDAVIAEVEWLEQKLQLFDLQGANNPNASNSEAAKNHKKFKAYFDKATEVLQQAYTSARSLKYQTFLTRILDDDRVFFLDAKYTDVRGRVNRQGPPPKYIQVRRPKYEGNPEEGSLNQNKYNSFKRRFVTLAQVQSLAATAGTTEREFLDASARNYVAGSGQLKAGQVLEGHANQQGGRTVRLYYVRLGDVIQAASDAAGLSVENQILLGSFLPRLSKFRYGGTGGHPGALSDFPETLANLPISLEYFGNWFYENVISKEREQYPFRRFLDDFLNGLVQPILTTLCGDQKDLRIGYTLHTVAADFLSQTLERASDSSTASSSMPTREGNPWSLQFAGRDFLEIVRSAAYRGAQAGIDLPLSTLLLIHAEQVNDTRTGDVDHDQKDGVYHFFLGADRGLVKQFNFSKKQMPQLRAMNIERVNKGATKAGILVLPMDVSLTMFGNGLLRNGSMIFVNADFGLGTRVADQLALGGYYRVYKCAHTIRPGFYETTIECIFERPRNFPDG